MSIKDLSRAPLGVTAVILGICMVSARAFAVLPPKVYEKLAEESKVKATAFVKSVQVIGHYNGVDEKVVAFKLIKSFGEVTPPETFKGRCKSVNKKWHEFGRGPGVGGDIYYYPRRGERVYVTISDNGSYITSFTRLNPGLQKALDSDPGSVKTRMGTAYVSR